MKNPKYESKLATARRMMGGRDEDDIALAALALKMEVPIWTNDRAYENFPHGMITTAALLKVLGT